MMATTDTEAVAWTPADTARLSALLALKEPSAWDRAALKLLKAKRRRYLLERIAAARAARWPT